MIPDWRPGEPKPLRRSKLVIALAVLGGLPFSIAVCVLCVPLWVLFLILCLPYGRPPNVPLPGRYVCLVRLISGSPAPWVHRAWLLLTVIRAAGTVPLRGIAWQLDELLYGTALDRAQVRAPLFEVSGGRSGSTQLARYIEEDPQCVAPSLLQSLVPYRWAWVLGRHTLGRVLPPAKQKALFERALPPEFLERHEGDPTRMDTFDGVIYLSHQLHLGFYLDPEAAASEFGTGRLRPGTRAAWEDFVRMVDRIGRKRLLDARPDQRLFIKGHFLCAAELLAQRFPDAAFFCVVRMPHERLRSGINYLRVNPPDPILGPPTWEVLAGALVRSEAEYCEAEQAWFSAAEGPRRCVLRFDTFRKDLKGSLQAVYREVIGGVPPVVLPSVHSERRRHGYSVDRSLEELHIDVAAFRQRLSAYEAWVQTPGPAVSGSRDNFGEGGRP